MRLILFVLSVASVLIWGLAPLQASAALIPYQLSVAGRIQAGDVVLGTTTVRAMARFDTTDLFPADPEQGAYTGSSPFLIRIDGDVENIVGDASAQVQFEPAVSEEHVSFFFVGAGGNQGSFFGRAFHELLFTFDDCCGRLPIDMLSSDALPTGAAFVERAGFVSNALFLEALPGDPFFTPGGFTRFTVCNALVTTVCEYADITVRPVRLPEPGTLALIVAGLLVWIPTLKRSSPGYDPAHRGRFIPTPTVSADLHVHPQRDDAITRAERWLVAIFLQRYVVWCGRTGHVDRLRGAVDRLTVKAMI
jgi:hypothetical protein